MDAMRKKVFDLTEGHCYYCGCELKEDNFEIDHVIAKAEEGKNAGNRVPSCRECNELKSKGSIEDLRQAIKNCVGENAKQPVKIVEKYMGIQNKDKDIVFYFEKKGLSPI